MKSPYYFLFALGLCGGLSCSKSSQDPTPTPQEENLTTPIAGIYKLTKVTNRNGTPVVTGVGSLTIVAVDNTTANITQTRSFTNTATGMSMELTSVKNEANKIAKSGSSYVIKSTNGIQWATIISNTISTSESIGSTLSTSSISIDTEYTKQ